MILPKNFFNKIEYFEYSMETGYGTDVYDTFTIHFKAWWRKARVIKIVRIMENYNAGTKTFTHYSTPGAIELHNQLNNWASSTFEESTFEEKPDTLKQKYTTNKTNNVITLKSKSMDTTDEYKT